MKKNTLICPRCARILWTIVIASTPEGKNYLVAVCMQCKHELQFEILLAQNVAA